MKQPKSPSTDEWMGKEDIVYAYNEIVLKIEFWHILQHEWDLKILC